MKRKWTGKYPPKANERLRSEIDHFMRGVMTTGRWISAQPTKTWYPPTDVYETDDHVVVKVEIAGMEEGDFTISLSGRMLTITGVRFDPAAKLAYQQMEIAYGRFQTEVYLPRPVADNEIEATYKDGFLKVVLPKAEAHKVPITAVDET